MVLGWLVDTRRLRISLPEEKAVHWSSEIQRVLEGRKVEHKLLERMIGTLTRAAFVVPGAMAFINPLRRKLYGTRRGVLPLEEHEMGYMRCWLKLLKIAREGTPMKRLTLRKPGVTLFTDASKKGMGGYCRETGMAWRCIIPAGVLKRTTINHIEFLAVIVFLWIAGEESRDDFPHVLAWVDNTCAVTWTRRTPRSDEFADFLFETYCTILLGRKFSLWGAHLAGTKNFVADILSRDVALSVKDVLQNITRQGEALELTTLYSLQVQDLPSPVNSWLSQIWETLMRPRPWDFRACKVSCTHGTDGFTFARSWTSAGTSTTSFTRPRPGSRPPSWRTQGGDDFEESLERQLVANMCNASWRRWRRPSSYGE